MDSGLFEDKQFQKIIIRFLTIIKIIAFFMLNEWEFNDTPVSIVKIPRKFYKNHKLKHLTTVIISRHRFL